MRRYLREVGAPALGDDGSKSPTISTPGSEEPSPAKSPTLSTSEAGSTEVPVSFVGNIPKVTGAEPGRPGLCQVHTEFISAKLDLGLTAKRIHQGDAMGAGLKHRLLDVDRPDSATLPNGKGVHGVNGSAAVD